MSLFNAIQGMGGGLQSQMVQDYQQQIRAKFGVEKQRELDPVEAKKIPGSESFSQELDVRATGVSRPGFSEMVERGVDHVDSKQKFAGNQVRMLMTGESDNLHGAMIAMEEAGIAFNLMLETRNKLMSSYQELMRLRV